jgi:hypothetical protein
VHSAGERETVPLSIHHLPFALTFAFFGVNTAVPVPWRSLPSARSSMGIHTHAACARADDWEVAPCFQSDPAVTEADLQFQTESSAEGSCAVS